VFAVGTVNSMMVEERESCLVWYIAEEKEIEEDGSI
jgi:hypothetical protein